MIKYAYEKSSGSDHIVWMDMFNNFINDTALMELVRGDIDLHGLISRKTLLEVNWIESW
jgi:hypothetical protein